MASSSDRLYDLLPAIYRERDLAAGEPLRALLGIISEQVAIVEQDIEQLYDNWFVETCDAWVLPYLGELLGYRNLNVASTPPTDRPSCQSGSLVNLVSRRDVANTLRNRRRKGTLKLLDDLAVSVAGWPCRAVEFDRLLVCTQSIKHLRMGQGRTALVRSTDAMGRIGTAFDTTAHAVDVRRPRSAHSRGRYNLPSLVLFVWRLQSFSVTKMAANCLDRAEGAYYTFSVLGNDCPLFIHPQQGVPSNNRPTEAELPARLTRARLADEKGQVSAHFYGEHRSFALWRRDDGATHLVPRERLVVADLSEWRLQPRTGTVAIDPELGRIAFAIDEAPETGLLVTYHYGFSQAMGGGEYARRNTRPSIGTVCYSVGPSGDFPSLNDALQRWKSDKPAKALIELTANEVYADPNPIVLHEGQHLELRASDNARPLLDLGNRHRDAREGLALRGAPGSRVRLVGLLVAGRGILARGHFADLEIVDCTLVPGWNISVDVKDSTGSAPSIRLENVQGRVSIERSVLGPVSVSNSVSGLEPLGLAIADSILDAGSSDGCALEAPEGLAAMVRLSAWRTTVIGHVRVAEVETVQDCIFNGTVDVAKRQAGCIRYSYLSPGSRTSQRFDCQPDLAIERSHPDSANRVARRVRPSFNSLRYGAPDYCQLSSDCSSEIAQGAEDGSEMGVFQRLHQPQRLANLQSRLDEYVPAGCDVGIVTVT